MIDTLIGSVCCRLLATLLIVSMFGVIHSLVNILSIVLAVVFWTVAGQFEEQAK